MRRARAGPRPNSWQWCHRLEGSGTCMMNEKPTGITANKGLREFTVTWNDGHTSVYPFGLLRAACPCASCRGGHENMRSEPEAEVFTRQMEDSPATRINNVVAVGSYALS